MKMLCSTKKKNGKFKEITQSWQRNYQRNNNKQDKINKELLICWGIIHIKATYSYLIDFLLANTQKIKNLKLTNLCLHNKNSKKKKKVNKRTENINLYK